MNLERRLYDDPNQILTWSLGVVFTIGLTDSFGVRQVLQRKSPSINNTYAYDWCVVRLKPNPVIKMSYFDTTLAFI
jgi:hypothetical protein